jgi:L-threonine kinase
VIAAETISQVDQCPIVITGKVGEFLQGVTSDGRPILYSATITSAEITTRALVLPASSFRVSVKNQQERNTAKMKRAIRGLLARRGIEQPWGFEVLLMDSSPSAKGLGASSADMAAGLLAMAQYLSLDVTEEELFSIMCEVERSDFLFWPDSLVCANPVSGEFSLQGPAPHLWLVGWDSEPKRRIITEAVAHLDDRRRRHAGEYADLISCCNSGETDALLYAMTRSAEINQEMLPKPCFAWACKVAKQFETALLVAHSGTFMAFAVPRAEGDMELLASLKRILWDRGFNPRVFQTGILATNTFLEAPASQTPWF